ncbi:MAG: LPS export ABC transporter periplasmic protein LptC [Cyclobacteriaceae bacterium]|nr:LPS export ABC transporter periplasmic protein LptC [Cyclobacteriaceae bacterium]MCH8515493.1 LPS export ABC transporter periplasmic protein LptC [Cyclobacteriaceae bacterium]
MKKPFFLLLVSFSVLLACESRSIDEMQIYEGPMMEVTNVETLYSDSAIVKVRLKTPKQLELQNSDREYPDGIYLEFYDEDGNISSTLRADYCYYTQKDNIYKGQGDVVVESRVKDQRMSSEVLYWEPSIGEVHTDTFVVIEEEGDVLKGEGMRAKQDFSSYTILKPIGDFASKEP